MKIFIYDGSFEGLLCSINYLIEKKLGDVQLKSELFYKPDLFSEFKKIETNTEFSQDFFKRLIKINPELQKILLFSYHSEENDFETSLLNFIRISIINNALPTDFSNQHVKYIMNLVRRVGHEIHRYKGFLRFNETENNTLFAQFSPKHNIIAFLGRHFINRMPNENWIIVDTKRGIAMEWDKSYLIIYDYRGKNQKELKLSRDEGNINRLWQTYFREIAIVERKNIRLQRQLMPKRYWKYLTEMNFLIE